MHKTGHESFRSGDSAQLRMMRGLTWRGLVKWSGNGIRPHWYLTDAGNKLAIELALRA